MRHTMLQNDWPTMKGNNRRSSQSPLPGRSRQPEILAQAHFGNYRGYLKLKPSAESSENGLELPTGVLSDFHKIEEDFRFNGLFYPVGGERIQRHDQANYRLFHLYGPEELNLVYVTEGLELHNRINSLVVCRVLDADLNTQVLWEVELPYYHERPHILIDDMNGDGFPEIVVEGWEGVTVYDSRTHAPIMDFPQELLHNSRKRGYVMTRDLDGNGFPDVIILSCYPWDVNVIGNNGKELSKKWFKIYDNHIESANIITRYTRLPIFDYNGDGRIEMVFNIWNETGDGQWHVKILDALTGNEVLDIPHSYLHDGADADGDGRLELFLSESSGIDVPEFSKLSVYQFGKGVVFTCETSKWACWCDSLPDDTLALHPNQNSRVGLVSLVTSREKQDAAFYLFTDNGTSTTLSRYTLREGRGAFSLEFPRGNRVELIKALPQGELLLRFETKYQAPAGIRLEHACLEPLCWGIPEDQRLSLPIIADLGQPSNSIVLANGVGQVVCYEFTAGGLRERWFTDGMGAAEQYDALMDYGVVADSFTGDQTKQVAVRVNGHGGGIKLVDQNGLEVWTREFDSIPSGDPCMFQGILGFYTSARANGKTYLAVSGQRNVQHTGITFGLDGKTGEQLWKLDTLNADMWYKSGAGSFYLTAFDVDGDGRDEVLTGYGNNIWAAHADTGEVLFENFMRGFWVDLWVKDYKSGWVASISPIPIAQSGQSCTLFCSNAGDSHGALTVDFSDETKKLTEKSRLLWGNEIRDYTDRGHQCLFDYQGNTLVAEPAFLDGEAVIHAIDPFTGAEFGAPFCVGGGAAAVAISCDIDGDGKQEIVFTAGKKLMAVRLRDKEWERVFSMEFENRLSWPVYGDINGDGFGELLVTDRNGALYLLG